MAAFADLCRFNPTLGGTTDFVFSSAVAGTQTPALAGVLNGVKYKLYAVSSDQSQWELYEGAYNSSTGTFPRTTVLFNSLGTGTASGQSGAGTKINFTTVPQVAIVGLAEDLISPETANSFTTTQQNQIQKNVGIPTVLQGWISGLTLSTAGSSATFSIAPGVATDSTAVDVLALASSISKTTAAWAVGSGNGALDTGSIAASTWYHAYLIKRVDTQVVDVMISLSATAPTLPTNYTLSRRIGAMKTNGSSQWCKFVQNGNDFLWDVDDAGLASPYNTSVPITATLAAMTVPTGVKVQAQIRAQIFTSSAGPFFVLLSSPDQSDQSASSVLTHEVGGTAGPNVNSLSIYTNTSGQIRLRSSNSAASLYVTTTGWTDTRGGANIAGMPQQLNLPGLLQGYLSGLTLSTAGSSATFAVAGGIATDSTNAVLINLASSMSKTTSAWSAGTGNGALDTGAIAASTWYHTYLIYRADTQVTDVLVSLSAFAPTLPSGYLYFRRIGAMKTNGSSQWTKFSQLGNEFLWDAISVDLNNITPGVTTAQTATLNVPTGVQVFANIQGQALTGVGADSRVYFSSLDKSDETVGAGAVNGGGSFANGTASGLGTLSIRTNTSSQIRYRVLSTTTTIYVGTTGWIDNRGSGVISTPQVSTNALGGDVNKFRNGTMDILQRGTAAITVTTAGAYSADGWIVLPTGASVTAQQAAGRSLTANSLKVTGATSVTDVVVKQRIESNMAAPMTSQTVTVQAQVLNNTGGSITPTLTVKHAGSADNYASPVTDVSAASLQACPNGVWTQVAYTFASSSSSANGLEIAFDFGNNFSTNGKSIQITECDIRVTPNVAIGLNYVPPTPELRPLPTELALCQRYYTSSYGNGVAPGTATTAGLCACGFDSAAIVVAYSIYYPAQMRATPTISFWDGNGNASKLSTVPDTTTSTTFTHNVATIQAIFNISNTSFIGPEVAGNVFALLQYTATAEL